MTRHDWVHVITLWITLSAGVLLAMALWDFIVERWRLALDAQVAQRVTDIVRQVRRQDCANGIHRTQVVPGVYLTERCVDCGTSWELGVAYVSGTNRRTKRGAG